MEHLTFAIELMNDTGEQGVIHGYAATFGNVDLGFDVIEPGAFADSIQKNGGEVPVLWQHNHEEPIGLGTVHEDKHGLKSKTTLDMNVHKAQEAYSLAKKKIIKGQSIGFITRDREFDDTGVRHILKADLMEYSLVTFAQNPRAMITQVKSERDFEKILRDVGFSRKEAKAIIAEGFRASQRDAGDDEVVKTIDELRSLLNARI
jgi:hypothetical protein